MVSDNRAPPTNASPTKRRYGHDGLTTLQVNALAQFLERRDFTASDIACYSYAQIARLPKIGSKGMVKIEAWLASHGLALAQPAQDNRRNTSPRERNRLSQAVRLLRKNGYGILPPTTPEDENALPDTSK